jgi:hypothetical protein
LYDSRTELDDSSNHRSGAHVKRKVAPPSAFEQVTSGLSSSSALKYRAFPEAGGLMSYGTLLADLDRRLAIYVDKILKGAKPADLPVEQPMKFEFIVNLKAAKQIGLTIPPNVVARADKVIK